MNAVEIGLSVIDARRLATLSELTHCGVAPARDVLRDYLQDAAVDAVLPSEGQLTHLYVGSEYCEHLFPTDAMLAQAARLTERIGLCLALATPIACDAVISRLADVAPRLPPGSEVIANDWGVANWLHAYAPALVPVAGRQLAKMIKDPRVANPAWLKVYPSNYAASPFAAFLARLGITRIELDVPPFATPETFAVEGLGVTVWAPYAYIAKGRICKVGALRQPLPEKFAPGRPCHHECLGLLEAEPEAGGGRGAGLRTYSRGTTMFYRHDAALLGVVREATARGLVSRLVWSEV